MKLYLARVRDLNGGENEVRVFATAKERKQFIEEVRQRGAWSLVPVVEITKHTCEFPATKEGIVAFFNRHAWHWQ
jgi:predicted component of type VI protein secretion system